MIAPPSALEKIPNSLRAAAAALPVALSGGSIINLTIDSLNEFRDCSGIKFCGVMEGALVGFVIMAGLLYALVKLLRVQRAGATVILAMILIVVFWHPGIRGFLFSHSIPLTHEQSILLERTVEALVAMAAAAIAAALTAALPAPVRFRTFKKG